MQSYVELAVSHTVALLTIDSPTGYTDKAVEYAASVYEKLGLHPQYTRKGGLLVCLNPDAPEENGLLLQAHLDTLGGMVAEITSSGRLVLTALGGLAAANTECENVRVITRSGKTYTGVFQLKNASVHVNGTYRDAKRDFNTMEVLLDEEVSSKQETEALGIMNGDIVCFDPRTVVTPSGFIKSRFLDDKLCAGILLAQAQAAVEGAVALNRRVWHHLTVFEEVGHGGAGSVPGGVTEAISLDMGCVGDGLAGSETKVSICAKDSRGPYHYETVSALIDAARRSGADFAVDVYPHYSSDVETTLSAGHDLRHGLAGPGVYASHGYERSSRKGVENTLKLLNAYLS